MIALVMPKANRDFTILCLKALQQQSRVSFNAVTVVVGVGIVVC